MARNPRDSVDMGLVCALASKSKGDREVVVQTLHTMEVAGICTLQHIRCEERWREFKKVAQQPQLQIATEVRDEIQALQKTDFFVQWRLRGKPRPPPTPRSEVLAAGPEPERVEALPPPPPPYPEGWLPLSLPEGTGGRPLEDGLVREASGAAPGALPANFTGTVRLVRDQTESTSLGMSRQGQKQQEIGTRSQDLTMLWEYMVGTALRSYRNILWQRAGSPPTSGSTRPAAPQGLLHTGIPTDIVPMGTPMPRCRTETAGESWDAQESQTLLCAEFYVTGHCTLGGTICPWRHMRKDLQAENI